MAGRSSRAKGARGEREVESILLSFGYKVRRFSPMQAGRKNAPEIVLYFNSLPYINIEVKRSEKINLKSALLQSYNTAVKNGIPYSWVVHRRNRERWMLYHDNTFLDPNAISYNCNVYISDFFNFLQLLGGKIDNCS